MSNKSKKVAAGVAATSKEKPASKSAEHAAKIAEQMGVDTIYENPQGEFFTVENLALLSVNQDKKKLIIHRSSVVASSQTPDIPGEDEKDGEPEDAGTGVGAE